MLSNAHRFADRVRPQRRWRQFSLRTLLGLMLIMSVGFGLFALMIQRPLTRQRALWAIENMGGSVGFLESTANSPRLERLGRFVGEQLQLEFGSVHLEDSGVTDAGLAQLPRLPGVEHLHLENTHITDAGLVHLERFPQLQVLLLDNTPITGAGLVHLQRLQQLEHLYLVGTHITGADLVHLQRLPKLRLLALNDTQVDDAGLVHLQGLNQLQFLFLKNTQVTDFGAHALRKTLPKCVVTVDRDRE